MSCLVPKNINEINIISIDFRLLIDELISIGALDASSGVNLKDSIWGLIKKSVPVDSSGKVLLKTECSAQLVYSIQDYLFGLSNDSSSSFLYHSYHYSIPVFIRDFHLFSDLAPSSYLLTEEIKDHDYMRNLNDSYTVCSYLFKSKSDSSVDIVLGLDSIEIDKHFKLRSYTDVKYVYEELF